MRWQDRAICKGKPVDWFFREGTDLADCRALCGVCPVRAECLADALRTGDDGYRAGTTFNARRRMLGKRVPRHDAVSGQRRNAGHGAS